MLHNRPYRFTGVNAYELGTYWSVNRGCGAQLADAELDTFFRGLRPDSLVRFWAFQSQASNRTTGGLDFRALDRVFRAAERRGQRLVAVLGNQDGTCDDGQWKDASWYGGGFGRSYVDPVRRRAAASYSAWVAAVVARYKSSPALGMWEPMNEPEAANCVGGYVGSKCYGHQICPVDATASLRHFFDAVGGRIKQLDPRHLVASGVIGSGQCGASGTAYATVHSSAGIDVATYHDYGHDTQPMPGDRWNGLAARQSQTQVLNKPLVTEEVGIRASRQPSVGCVDLNTRASQLGAKLAAQRRAGVQGFLVWFYNPRASSGCDHALLPTDPTLQLLRTS